MRREHITQSTSNPLLDFLQAHGCSFYSPLSANDTTDWISGNPMQQYASGSVLWDGNINMWKFTYEKRRNYNTTIATPSGYLVEDINGNEKLHLYPALRIADPKPGIYDTVNHQFYTNQGTGEFYTHKDMTQTINIKVIIIALLAVAVIALALAMGHRSVSHTKVQLWQADTSWVSGWN